MKSDTFQTKPKWNNNFISLLLLIHLFTQTKKNSGQHQTQRSHVPIKNDSQIQRLVGSSQICVQPAFIVGKMYYWLYYDVNCECDVKCITFMHWVWGLTGHQMTTNTVAGLHGMQEKGINGVQSSWPCANHKQSNEWNSLQAAQCLPTDKACPQQFK